MKNLLDKLCQKYQVNIGQLLNSWAVLHDYHIIPKSSNPNRVKDNFHLISSISKQDMKLIDFMNHFSTDEYKKLVRQWDKNSSEEKEKLFEKVLLYKEHF